MYVTNEVDKYPIITNHQEGNYLAHWLKLAIDTWILSTDHVLYQSVDAFITEQLQQPHPVLDWTTRPTLYSFCESLFSIGTSQG